SRSWRRWLGPDPLRRPVSVVWRPLGLERLEDRTLLSVGLPPVPVGAGPQAIAVGNFDGDDRLDFAVANKADRHVSVLLGNGDGTFQDAGSYAIGASPVALAVGDLNGDHIQDLVVANSGAGTVSVLLGNGDGTFQDAVPYAAGGNPSAVAIGHFD